ncbi:MAG: hypothetical protein JWP87_1355 [Labilithrix sp.]|nr:hypothetical protein [Labilithrix sp.]
MVARRTVLVAAALGMLVLGAPDISRADAPAESALAPASSSVVPEALMAGLAQHAARFEEMKRRGAFTMTGRMEEVDGDGKASDTKEIQLRSTPTPAPMDRITNVIRYTENGKDKTADAQKRATERRAKRLGDPEKQAEEKKKDLKLPFLAPEQARYVFSVAERDPADASRVRIAFHPKTPAENAIKGSAWVDEKEREVLSVGFSLSKNPTFVDHVEITIVFGLPTELGRAPSKLSFDGRGGFLFIRKHYRGTATLSEPKVAF